MAKITEVRLVDDLDGSEAESTVVFGLDGKNLEIDLSAENRKQLEEALAPFIDKARRVTGRAAQAATPAKSRTRSGNREELAAIRAWGQANGFEVNQRGRVSGDLRAAYNAEHGISE